MKADRRVMSGQVCFAATPAISSQRFSPAGRKGRGHAFFEAHRDCLVVLGNGKLSEDRAANPKPFGHFFNRGENF